MEQQFVNNKSNRNSTGKTLSSLSLSSTSLSSASSISSPNLRQSQSFVYNNNNSNSKYNNYNSSARYSNSANTEKPNRRLNNSNQATRSFSNNNINRKPNFNNNNKGAKNRQFFENNNNFNSSYGNSNCFNENSNGYECKKKNAPNQTSSKVASNNCDNEETPQKKYKERKNISQQTFKDGGIQSNRKTLFGIHGGPTIDGNLCKSEKSIGSASIASTINLNYKYQPPPFQPPAYHQNNKQFNNNKHNFNQNQSQQTTSSQKNKMLLEKYDRKYNLISFILLRKKDEYLIDKKFYLNDQTLYQKIESLIEKRQLKNLKSLFLNEQSLATDMGSSPTCPINQHLSNYNNSYNCNIFVYTIRKCLESLSPESLGFANELIRFLFNKKIRPFSFYLIDGDYPKRNLMHYAARYNCELIPCLLLESFKENNAVKTENLENLEKKTITNEEDEGINDTQDKYFGYWSFN